MLITLKNFGGLAPKVISPSLLPDGKSQIATNCRFDKGGFVPICEDKPIEDNLIPSTPPAIYTVRVQFNESSYGDIQVITDEGTLEPGDDPIDIPVVAGGSVELTIQQASGVQHWAYLDGDFVNYEIEPTMSEETEYTLAAVQADHVLTFESMTPPM